MRKKYEILQTIASDIGNLAHARFELLTITAAEHPRLKDLECKRVQQAFSLAEGEDVSHLLATIKDHNIGVAITIQVAGY
jgi:hypothetical protein